MTGTTIPEATPVIEEVPLIWTSKGNLPIADLRYETAWEDGETFLTFKETYYLGDEVVKCSMHGYSKKSLEVTGEQATY